MRDRARAAIEAGYRAYRVDAGVGGPIANNVFNTRERVRLVVAACKEIREGVGKDGDWTIDVSIQHPQQQPLHVTYVVTLTG